jgi:hypothetical protein
MLIKLPKIMPTHQATFINDEFKNGYQPNESRTIVTEIVNGKIRVTSPGAWPGPDPIIYDTEEDFFKDWRIESPDNFRGWQVILNNPGNG